MKLIKFVCPNNEAANALHKHAAILKDNSDDIAIKISNLRDDFGLAVLIENDMVVVIISLLYRMLKEDGLQLPLEIAIMEYCE